jgi:DNA topoisomerase-1
MIIYRKKINEEKKIYKYLDKAGKEIKDKKILDYIAELPAIPPAYNDVEIFYEKSPKILFQGTDSKGRLQQIYSPKWRANADKIKFKSLINFGKKLPKMTTDMIKHLKSKQVTKDKLISIILLISNICGFRVGSVKYQKLYGSFGLITLQVKHIKKMSKEQMKKIKNPCIKAEDGLFVSFPGKKGVINECIITDNLIINTLEDMLKTKKQDEYVFSYIDPETKTKEIIKAIDINNWLKKYDESFTSKFFRTFLINPLFIKLIADSDYIKMSESQRKKQVVGIIKELSCSINNTPAIAKKSYLDPNLINMYINHPNKYKSIIDISKGYMDAYVKFLEHIH